MTNNQYGSDLIVDLLQALGIEYFAYNPGTTFRGLHESLVNYSDGHPEMVLCLHEEIAVAMAQGYGAAAGKPMAVGVHGIVGLEHAAMALYNAWCDKTPVMILGGAAPLDPHERRNRPDWLHAANVPGNLVRDLVKWDDYVVSSTGLVDSFVRAYRLAVEHPRGPVYICLDSQMQESLAIPPVEIPPLGHLLAASPLYPDPGILKRVATLLVKAERPIILADLMGRTPEAVASLRELAELLAIPVIDLGRRFNFPNNHPLDLKGDAANLISRADVILALDVEDLRGELLRGSAGNPPAPASKCQVIDISLRDLAIRSLVQDCQRFQPADITLMADTAAALPQLVGLCRKMAGKASPGGIRQRQERSQKRHDELRQEWRRQGESLSREEPIAMGWLLHEIWPAIKNEDWVLTSGHAALVEWARRLWVIDKPYQLIPAGGIGLGRGMGVAMGAALANRKHDRLVINLQPDGDLLYTPQAIWTAASNRIPLVVVIYNNRCYGNSEYFFALTARSRGRNEETRGQGAYLDSPPVDFVSLARSFGAHAEGPITEPDKIAPAVKRAVKQARKNSGPAVVEVLCRRTDNRHDVR